MAFQPSECEQAYARIGILGFQSSGKTTLAKNLAIGLHDYCQKRGAMTPDAPVFFLDTETGSDWVRKSFVDANIKLLVDKTRTFTRLVPAIREVEQAKGILIIDSITHFWRELTESYASRKGRTSLRFDDWAWLKGQWGKFTDAFVNSQCHVIMCGRAGYEYDFFEDDAGKKELVKTGIKMKAEAETGYEPSLLILMERHMEMEGGTISRVYRNAMVVKDRAALIDGQVFKDPVFENFLPHINELNLGAQHVGVDTTTSSTNIVPPDSYERQNERQEREIVLDEIQQFMVKLYPSSKSEDKLAKTDMLEQHFGTRSWKRVESMPLQDLRKAYRDMMQPSEAAQVF